MADVTRLTEGLVLGEDLTVPAPEGSLKQDPDTKQLVRSTDTNTAAYEAFPGAGPRAASDPGDAGAIPVTSDAAIPLVSGGSNETRTCADPTYAGQQLFLLFATDGGGDVEVTFATNIDGTNDTATFATAGQGLMLISTISGVSPTVFKWVLQSNIGSVSLS